MLYFINNTKKNVKTDIRPDDVYIIYSVYENRKILLADHNGKTIKHDTYRMIRILYIVDSYWIIICLYIDKRKMKNVGGGGDFSYFLGKIIFCWSVWM